MCYQVIHFKDSEELLCRGMILPHESADRAHCRLPNSDTLQGVSEHQKLRRTVLLYHDHAAPEPHAVSIRMDALLIPLVSGVGFAVRLSRNDGALRIACSPAQVRLLQFLQRKVLIGTLLQDLESGSQAQPLFLLCPTSPVRHLHSNRELLDVVYG